LIRDTFLHFRDTDELMKFDGSIYDEHGEQLVTEISAHVLGEAWTSHRANETVRYIKAATDGNIRHVDNHEDHVPVTLIPVGNGVFNLNTEKLTAYDAAEPFFTRLAAKYDAAAECPRFKQFLSEVVGEGDIAVLQEFLGYCLYRDYLFAKTLLLVGSGHNGKSVFLQVIDALLGEKNVSHESLQSLCENRFAQAELVGKYANIYADLPDKAVWETGVFKILTGNDVHTVEKKGRNPFDTKNHAKLIFSCNKIPESYDDSDAYYRRFIIVTFPNQFPEGDPKTDPHLIDKLREELPGIFNYAVAGLQRLLLQNKFSSNKSLEEIRAFYKRQASSVSAFVEDMLEVEPQSELTKDGVYSNYCAYCRTNGIASVAKPTFGKKLPQYIEVASGRSSEKGRPRTWRGIRFKNASEDEKQGDLREFA
jgi:putative DNA primase/helicase